MKKAGLFMVGIVRAAVLSFGMTMVKPSTTHTNPVNYSRIYRSRCQCKIARTKMNRYTAALKCVWVQIGPPDVTFWTLYFRSPIGDMI